MITYSIIQAKNLDIEIFKNADPSEDAIRVYKDKSIAILAKIPDGSIIALLSFHNSFFTGFEINNLFVDEDYRNQGFAKELIKKAEKIVKKQGGKYFEVCTGNSSIEALALYQKAGFRIVGIDRDYFLTRYDKRITEHGIECLDLIRLRKTLN